MEPKPTEQQQDLVMIQNCIYFSVLEGSREEGEAGGEAEEAGSGCGPTGRQKCWRVGFSFLLFSSFSLRGALTPRRFRKWQSLEGNPLNCQVISILGKNLSPLNEKENFLFSFFILMDGWVGVKVAFAAEFQVLICWVYGRSTINAVAFVLNQPRLLTLIQQQKKTEKAVRLAPPAFPRSRRRRRSSAADVCVFARAGWSSRAASIRVPSSSACSGSSPPPDLLWFTPSTWR